MVRWRWCLLLAMLLVLPAKSGSKSDDDDEEGRRGEDTDDDEDEDEEDEDEELDKSVNRDQVPGRRAPMPIPTVKSIPLTRTPKRRPLECYVCAYKAETPLRACLDPTKFRVHTITCHSIEDKCFTSVISKGSSYEAVVRGCRSGCTGSPETTCCELNRCNNQAFAMPLPLAQQQILTNSETNASKVIQPSIVFFVSILLVLQTVVKVAFL